MTRSVPVAPRVSTKVSRKRNTLMISCASAAIAVAAVIPQKAQAQAYNGTITASTNASQTGVGAGTETITVTAGKAVIDWAPNEAGTGNINFLPNGNVATYVGASGVTDYTVLNRVVPDGARAIELNGRVQSQLDGGATGGKVWFYSPNGIVVGSTAVFDVGGLLLTTAFIPDLNEDGSPDFTPTANGFSFRGLNVVPGSSVEVAAGAQINALAQNSYVALIAPRVSQGGTVQVNGTAAYVAAENLTMTMNQGLFDIAVDVGGGTTDEFGVVHSGVTGGPASTGAGDNHRVYMVAVPKNQALEMLLGGSVGFDATTAGVVNGEIILGAGTNILEADGSLAVGSLAGINADLTINPGMYLSNVQGFARGDINAMADTGSLAFSGDLSLKSLNSGDTGSITAGALVTHNFTVGGDLLLQTNNSTYTSNIDLRADGGTVLIGGDANIFAGGAIDGTIGIATLYSGSEGSLTINGATVVSVLAPAAGINPDVGSSDNYAGDISIVSSGDAGITFGDNVSLYASANGQDNSGNGDGTAGDGQGGNISMTANGGWITVNGDLYANADGYGGNMLDGGLVGGGGYGGSIWIGSYERDITINGNAFLTAIGTGGSYVGEGIPTSALGGTGEGGWVNIFTGGPGLVAMTGDNTLRADGTGGHGQTGGYGFGGNAGAYGYDGAIDLGTSVSISARGTGGNAVIGYGGSGGNGQGGTAFIEALAEPGNIEVPPSQSTITGGSATLDASGYGGDGGAGFVDEIEQIVIAAGAGGTGHGGLYDSEIGSGGAFAAAQEPGASLALGDTTLTAIGVGGTGGTGAAGQDGGAGGAAYGGTVQAGNYDTYATGVRTASATYGDLTMNASANGGVGGVAGTGGVQGNGGSATGGGNVSCNDGQLCGGAFLNAKGSVTADNVTMTANGNGGAGATGGSAQGGYAGLASYADSSVTILGIAYLAADATGGAGEAGGSATGGYAQVQGLAGGTLEIAGDLSVRAFGFGGTGFNGAGGAALGGSGLVTTEVGAVMNVGGMLGMWSDAYGGGGSMGGNAAAGTTTVTVDGGSLDVGAGMHVVASAWGGAGESGVGGDGQGGSASITVQAGGTISAVGEILSFALAEGGNGVSLGGNAIGGNAMMTIDGGYIAAGDTIVSTKAEAGNATDGDGGSATGGDNLLSLLNGGELTTGFINLDGAAFGGDGSWAGGAATAGSSSIVIAGGSATAGSIGNYANAWGGSGAVGGDATGGSAAILFTANGGSLDVIGVTGIEAMGFGGEGTVNNAGTGGSGGDGFGGDASLSIGGGTATTGDVKLRSNALGGNGGNGVDGGDGGDGTAGSSTITVDAGGLLDSGAIENFSRGFGGDGGNGTTGLGGDGGNAIGGTTSLTVAAGGALEAASYHGSGNGPAGYDLDINNNPVSTGGNGGTGAAGAGAGGSGTSGSENGAYIGGTTTIAGNFIVTTFARGGDGSTGGSATAGSSSIVVDGTLTVGGRLQSSASALGGNGSTGVGGDASAGTASVSVDGAVTAGSLFVATIATGGNGVTAGGDGFAGDASFTVNSGTAQITGSGQVQATGTGGSANNGAGGDGTGGYARVTTSGSLAANNLTVQANGIGGAGVDGGWGVAQQNVEGWGGAAVQALPGGSLTLTGTTLVEASATGGNGTTGAGGGAVGGFSQIFGATSLGGTVNVNAVATGGAGGTGGHATAGEAIIEGSTINATSVSVNASATGGAGTSGLGGNALAGAATLQADGASLSITNLTNVRANAQGGAGATGGGIATGGGAAINVAGIVANFGSSTGATAHAVGGASSGGTGGSAQAGNASITVAAGGQLNGPPLAQLAAGAVGTGGAGVDGGSGTGGTASVNVQGSLTTGGEVLAYASGLGGGATTGTGGLGQGGTASIVIDPGASANVAYVDIVADGFGGHSTGWIGGDGYAGMAQVEVQGALAVTGETWVSAEAEGGDGAVNGGSGTGGTAILYAQNGGTVQLGTVTNILADGSGGVAGSNLGGDGFGGNATLAAYDDSTLSAHDLTVSASGDGGDGRSGGFGYGGTDNEGGGGALVEANGFGASVTLTGQATLRADGTGGNAQPTGAGGGGTGGNARLSAQNGGLSFASALISTVGQSGTGGTGFSPGTGGEASLSASGGSLTGTSVTITSDGSEAGGTVRIASFSGEFDGELSVGAVTATASGGFYAGDVLVDVAAGSIADLGEAVLTSNGGVPGSDEDGIELDILGELNATNLTLTSSDDIQINTHFGGTINVANTLEADSLGLITMSDNGYSGPVNATVVDLDGANIAFDATVNAQDILFTVDGDYAITELPFASNLLSITAGGDITAAESVFYSTSLLLNAGADLTTFDIFTGDNLTLSAVGNISTADLTAGDNLTLNAGGNITTADMTAGGGIAAGAEGNLTVGDVVSGFVPTDVIGQAVVASGEDVLLSAGGNMVFGNGDSGGDFEFYSGGTVTGGNIFAEVSVHGENAGAMTLGDVSAGAGTGDDDTFSVSLVSGGSIIVGDVTGPRRIGLATLGDLTAGTLNSGTDVMTLVAGNIVIESIMTGAEGRVYMANASMCAAGGGCSSENEQDFNPEAVLALAPVATGGSITINGPVTTGTLQAAAGSNLSLGDVEAGALVDVAAGGLASFSGVISSPEITVTSGDITIADGGSFGVAGTTNLITFNAVSDGTEVILGGVGTEAAEGQYQLAEDGDIVADAVVFNAIAAEGGSAPDVRVLDAEIEGSQTADGGVASVTLNTDGNVFVEGQVNFANAAATDTLSINAGETIQVITDNGGISITDSNGDISGVLELTAHDIWVADQATLDQIAANPDFDGVEDLLSVNNGPVDPDGSIQAGGMSVTMLGSSFLVQNTGSETEHAGLTVGEGGLSIVNQGSDPATVVIYGRQVGSDGSVIGGEDFFEEVEFAGSGGFAGGSTVNGCEVGGGCSPDIEQLPGIQGPESILGPIGLMGSPSDEVGSDEGTEEEEEEEGSEGEGGADGSVGLINTGPVSIDQPIDQPVTSGSDTPDGGK